MWPQRVRYALRALIALSLRPSERISAGEIARRYDIPPKYLESILLELRQAGIVESTKGKSGGYRLTREPAALRLLTVVQALEPDWFSPGVGGPAQNAPERSVLASITEDTRAALEKLTLADALTRWQDSSDTLTYVI